jgi:putative ABC transport system substrate-binding protein
MKGISILIHLFTLAVLLSGSGQAADTKIGMIIEKEDTATYQETLEGFRAVLNSYGKPFTFEEMNARNDRAAMETIAASFEADPSIGSVVVLGSVASAITSQRIRTKPLICGGLNHPKRLGISGDNVTGTTYYIAPPTVINLIVRLNPAVKKIGMLYEPPDQNGASAVEVPETESALKALHIDFMKEEVRTAEDIVPKTAVLAEAGVEYIVIPTNRLLYSNVKLIRDIADPAGVPVVSFSRKGVYGGALIGITSNNRLLGERMGQMLIEVTEEARSPKDIPWYFPEKYSILINEQTRRDLGAVIPGTIYGIATIVNDNHQDTIPGKP